MPKQCFINLPDEKKDRIFAATLMQLAQTSGDDLSINQVIKYAGISRGSFYQYFHDKEDLVNCTFLETTDKVKDRFIYHLKEENGDVFKLISGLFEEWCNNAKDEDYRVLITNYLNTFKLTKTTGTQLMSKLGLSIEYFIGVVNEYNTANPFKNTDELFIQNVLELMFILLINTICNVFSDYDEIDYYKENFYSKLDIIKFGALQ